jgi:6-phosphogluconolactonase/glucosamine-6-phosphate isomerase/deaminase
VTLPFLDRAFDVIFVVAGDNKASVVQELFNVRNRRFKYPVERVQPKSRSVLCPRDDFAEAHRPPNLFSGNQRC